MPIFNQGSGGGGGLLPRIIVTAPTGSTVTCVKDAVTLTATESSGTWTFDVPDFGTWTVNATKGAESTSKTVNVNMAAVYEVTLAYVDETLNNNTWAVIQQVSQASTGANYWSVGDRKQITVNGTFGDTTISNYSTWVYIIGFDHNSSREGTGIAFQGFKTAQTGGIDVCLIGVNYSNRDTTGFNMNTSDTNTGGWNGSRMKKTTLPAFMQALPSDLQAVIKTTTLYTDNTGGGSDVASYVTATQEQCYLLAEWEIFGARSYANSAEKNYQTQYAYYSAGNSKVKYRHDSTSSTVYWWGRSPTATANSIFCRVNTNGGADSGNASRSYGLAVAFKV